MIWSVSTLLRRSGTPMPVWVVKDSMGCSWSERVEGQPKPGSADRLEVGRGGQGATHGRGGGHHRGDQVGAPALALPALEVAVGGGGRPLPRLQLVGVHAQAHRAAGLAPFGTEVQEEIGRASCRERVEGGGGDAW